MLALYTFIFITSCLLLALSSRVLIDAIVRIARFLKWKEFVTAFLIMSIAGSIPEFSIGITSAIYKIPQLSFGNIVGANVIDFTLVIALAGLILGNIKVESKTVQTSCLFMVISATLPLILTLDKTLSRSDALILILSFFIYIFWLFGKKDRFSKTYDKNSENQVFSQFNLFLKDLGKVIGGIILLFISTQGIIASSDFFAQFFNSSLSLIGILIVGLGTVFPETYFCLLAARQNQPWMVLGNLMGSVVVPATMVLGIVAFIYPIQITDFSSFAIARIFLLISALFFLIAVRTERKITKKEALVLLLLYILFVICELTF